MFIIFFLFLVSIFYFIFLLFFLIFDGLTICHPSPTTRHPSPATHHPPPVTRGKVLKAKGKGYQARKTKRLIGGWLQLFMQMSKIFLLFFQEYFSFRNGTFAFNRIILDSFKLHYFFLTSITCDEYFALRTQIRSDASSC